MGRKYVRDKAGRFAPKGGGTKGKGGKMGKSAKNLKARATYKAAASKLRKKQSGIGINTSKGSAGHRKQIGGAKSGLTRVTNKLTKKRAAAGSGLKKNFANQAKASRAKKFSSKATKGRAAKKEYKAASGKDRQGGRYIARKAVIKKQTGKKAYNAVDPKTGKQSLSRTKARPAGSMNKAEKLRASIKKKKFANLQLRGSEFKGVKKRPATKKKAAAKKTAAAKKAQGTAKQRYKKAKTAAKTAERFSIVDRGTKEARKGAAAKGKFTKMKKSMRKGATEGKGYGLSKKGQEARMRRRDLIRERGGATKGRGTAAQKRAGIGYRQTQAAFGLKTKGRVPKGRLPGGETLKQQMKSAPQKQSWRGKGSKAKRRAAELAKKVPRTQKGAMAYDGPNKARSRAADRVKARTKALRDARNLRNAAKASNTPKGAKKNYTKRANEIAKATRTPKATKGRSAKAQYKKLSGNARKNFRIGDARRGKSPAEIRGKHNLSRGVKKTKGAKKYIDTRNTEYPMFQRFKKSELKRKFKL